MPRSVHRRRDRVIAFDAPNWEPPPMVVLDTNVVAEALLPDELEHAACDALLERLGTEGTVVVFNRLLEVETWEAVFNRALRMEASRTQVRHRRFLIDGRAGAVAALSRAEREWNDRLTTLDWRCVEMHHVADAVPDLMRSYGLQSYDAVHAATLLASGATDLVTRDAGFAALLPEDATIHTTKRRLATTRVRRRSVASAVGAG